MSNSDTILRLRRKPGRQYYCIIPCYFIDFAITFMLHCNRKDRLILFGFSYVPLLTIAVSGAAVFVFWASNRLADAQNVCGLINSVACN